MSGSQRRVEGGIWMTYLSCDLGCLCKKKYPHQQIRGWEKVILRNNDDKNVSKQEGQWVPPEIISHIPGGRAKDSQITKQLKEKRTSCIIFFRFYGPTQVPSLVQTTLSVCSMCEQADVDADSLDYIQSSCVKGAEVFRIPRRVRQRLSSWESVQSNHYKKERKPTSTYLTVTDELPDRVATKRETLITARFHWEDYKNE